MADREWAMESEAEEKPSRIGWFAAGALAVIALIGALVMAATVVNWPSNADEAEAETPPVIIEGY
jgi:hypothetical protein